MIISRLQSFVDSPITKTVDAAAVATGAATALVGQLPDFRASLHEWGLVAVDIIPIATVLWLLLQGVCKVIVTYHAVHPVPDEAEGDE